MTRLALLPAAALLLGGCVRQEVSPLASAARIGDVRAIEALAGSGSSLNGRSGVNGWTPLMHAIHKNQPASVRALLEAGANPDAMSPRGVTPLMMAAGYGFDEIIDLLLAHHANPLLRDAKGRTATQWARSGTFDIDRMTIGRVQTRTLRLLEEAESMHHPVAN